MLLPGSFLPQIRSLFPRCLREKASVRGSEPVLPHAPKAEQATRDAIICHEQKRCYNPATAKSAALQPPPSASDPRHGAAGNVLPGDSAPITSKAVLFKQKKVSFV